MIFKINMASALIDPAVKWRKQTLMYNTNWTGILKKINRLLQKEPTQDGGLVRIRSLRKWHWTWHLKHGFVNKYYVQLCWSHFYSSYKTGSRERLECRVCVGEGHETRLERWAGTRSWKALHTILGNFVLSWGWWILWTTEGLEARLRETSSNLYFRRVSLRKLTVEDWLEKARLH